MLSQEIYCSTIPLNSKFPWNPCDNRYMTGNSIDLCRNSRNIYDSQVDPFNNDVINMAAFRDVFSVVDAFLTLVNRNLFVESLLVDMMLLARRDIIHSDYMETSCTNILVSTVVPRKS